jgi:4-amino-4-deoxy-L-arabinose transferase-like glycosyltransferase
MLRCDAVRIPVALYALALMVRAVLFGLHPDAAYPDSYYYVDVARALQAGHGFSVNFVYSFVEVGGRLPLHAILPIPSNVYWLPLASIVQLPSIWLFGPTAFASALPFLLIGSLAAPLTWLIARDVGCQSRVALAAGVAVAIPAAATIYATQPDNFSLYQPLATAALWLAARGLRGHRRSFVLAGLMVGLASLSRNDGILLAVPVGLAFVWDRWRAWRSRGTRLPRIRWIDALACAGLFLAVMAPWYIRQLAVFGQLSPATASGRVLFIQTYSDMNSITSDTSLAAFLSQGIGPILASRIQGLMSEVVLFSVVCCSVVLVPFVVGGLWARRRSFDFGPYLVYASLLFVGSALVFPVLVTHGTFLHSAVALVPFGFIAGLEGVVLAANWAVRHRRGWTEERAVPMFLIAAVGSLVISAAMFSALALGPWNAERDARIAAGHALDAAGVKPSDLLMTADPAGFEYFTGHGGVVTPSDPLPVVNEVATAYDIRWLILERAAVTEQLIPVIESKVRPAWIGAPIFSVPYDGPKTGDPTVDNAPALAIYPVCTVAGDTRCSSGPLGDSAANAP